MAAPDESTSKKKVMADQESVDRECTEVEEELAELRVVYEKYFMGIEHRAPQQRHDALKRRINRLRSSFVRSTSGQFRVQTVIAKMISFERLWMRTLEQKENGTYRPDLYKAKLRTPSASKKQEEEKKKAEPVSPAPAAPPGLKPSGPPGLKPASVSAPAPVAKTALNETKLKEVYDAYVNAKKRCNEDISKLSYEVLANTLKKQVPELLKKHNARDVDFKVIIKDGKAVLKAVPKE